MHLNSNMLGLAVAPLPGFGILGKVPSRFAHLVELKKSVRDKAWAHWMAAPGLVTHNTSHKSKQSASSSGNNGASKSKIRLTAGTGGNAGGSSSSNGAPSASSNANLAVNNSASSAVPATAAQDSDTGNTAEVPLSVTSATTNHSEPTEMEVDPPGAVAVPTDESNKNKHKTQFALHKPAKKLCKRSSFEKGYFLTDTYIED